MTVWNRWMDGYKEFMGWMKSWRVRIRGWFHPDAGSWFLYSNSLFPVSFSHRFGLKKGDAPWVYYPATRRLVKKGGTELYRVGWLSARILSRPHSSVQEMDAFLEELRIVSEQGMSPPLTVFLQAWSLYNRHWWLTEEEMRLEWIDVDAEEHGAGPREKIDIPLVCMERRAREPEKKNRENKMEEVGK